MKEKQNLNESGSFAGKTVAVLGLAFKANTDDIRYSAAINIIELLIKSGATINAYDPQATENMKQLFPDINYCSSALQAVTDADACIIVTEWDEFKTLDLQEVASVMNHKILIDARGIIDETQLQQLGFAYDVIGKRFV